MLKIQANQTQKDSDHFERSIFFNNFYYVNIYLAEIIYHFGAQQGAGVFMKLSANSWECAVIVKVSFQFRVFCREVLLKKVIIGNFRSIL